MWSSTKALRTSGVSFTADKARISGGDVSGRSLPQAAGGRTAQSAAARVRTPAQGLRVWPILALLLLVCQGFALAGCAGYQLATESSSVLGDGSKTLKVKGVDYPTMHPWLPYAIRSRLRDEIGARYLAKWVDSGSADYEIQINVLSFTSRRWIRSEVDTSQLFDSTMTIEAILYEGSTNKEIWRSGKIAYSERMENVDDKALAGDLITQVVRMLADKMRNTF